MYQKLVSHNQDLNLLVEKGYAVSFDSNYLIIRDIPYLNKNRDLLYAAFICKLVYKDPETVMQEDHQVFFTGESPCDERGMLIPNLADRPATLSLSEKCKDLIVQRQFSNKPFIKGVPGSFENFFEKIESYTSIISGPAMELYKVKPYTFNHVIDIEESSVFKFQDTLTSRAEIVELSNKFKDEVVAIIGLGGTGSYILDFLVKTPVKEIKGFDFDDFFIHNAFRSPGKTEEIEFKKKKTLVYQERYSNFRHGLFLSTQKIGTESLELLQGVTFAFVCVDNGESRAEIFEVLISLGIPYIDVGMGLSKKSGSLSGMVRTTYYPEGRAQKVLDENLSDLSKKKDNLYRTNIQIGELNALNACLAVIKFKQYKGFYSSEETFYHSLFNISDLKIVSESIP